MVRAQGIEFGMDRVDKPLVFCTEENADGACFPEATISQPASRADIASGAPGRSSPSSTVSRQTACGTTMLE